MPLATAGSMCQMVNSVSGVPYPLPIGSTGVSTAVKVDGQALVRMRRPDPVRPRRADDPRPAGRAVRQRRGLAVSRAQPPPSSTCSCAGSGTDLALRYAGPGGASRTPTSTAGGAAGRPRRRATSRSSPASPPPSRCSPTGSRPSAGELAALGHPDYGSRHHELIGEPNVERTRNLIKLYVLQALRREPRIEKVLALRRVRAARRRRATGPHRARRCG